MQFNCTQFFNEMLQLIDSDPAGFYYQIVTGDKSWIHYHNPKSQQEIKQWKHKDSLTPKQP